RHMAEDCVNQAATLARLPECPCPTINLAIHGSHSDSAQFGRLAVYGSDAPAIQALMTDPSLAQPLDSALPYTADAIVWAARHEMARTVEDALARRTRTLFLNAQAALRMAPLAASLMARELGYNDTWEQSQVESFRRTAQLFTAPATPS